MNAVPSSLLVVLFAQTPGLHLGRQITAGTQRQKVEARLSAAERRRSLDERGHVSERADASLLLLLLLGEDLLVRNRTDVVREREGRAVRKKGEKQGDVRRR